MFKKFKAKITYSKKPKRSKWIYETLEFFDSVMQTIFFNPELISDEDFGFYANEIFLNSEDLKELILSTPTLLKVGMKLNFYENELKKFGYYEILKDNITPSLISSLDYEEKLEYIHCCKKLTGESQNNYTCEFCGLRVCREHKDKFGILTHDDSVVCQKCYKLEKIKKRSNNPELIEKTQNLIEEIWAETKGDYDFSIIEVDNEIVVEDGDGHWEPIESAYESLEDIAKKAKNDF